MIHDSNAIPANNRNKRARLQEDGGFIAPFIPQNIPTTAIPLARTPLIHPSTAAAPLAPNNNVEWPEEDDGEQVHIPNDTEAAIQLLIAQFPAAIKTVRMMLIFYLLLINVKNFFCQFVIIFLVVASLCLKNTALQRVTRPNPRRSPA